VFNDPLSWDCGQKQKSHEPRLRAVAFARARNTEQSQKLVEKLNQLFPTDFTIQTFSLPATRAAIKLAQNDPATAIEILRPLTPYDLAIGDSFDNTYPAYLRGLAYLKLKKGDRAAAEFRRVLDHSGVVQGFVTGALSILQLARARYSCTMRRQRENPTKISWRFGKTPTLTCS
jgi:hypothetical protein